MEGGKWSGAYNAALAGVGKQELVKQMAVAGIFYHLYNQVSHTSVKSPLYLCTKVRPVGIWLSGIMCAPCMTVRTD